MRVGSLNPCENQTRPHQSQTSRIIQNPLRTYATAQSSRVIIIIVIILAIIWKQLLRIHYLNLNVCTSATWIRYLFQITLKEQEYTFLYMQCTSIQCLETTSQETVQDRDLTFPAGSSPNTWNWAAGKQTPHRLGAGAWSGARPQERARPGRKPQNRRKRAQAENWCCGAPAAPKATKLGAAAHPGAGRCVRRGPVQSASTRRLGLKDKASELVRRPVSRECTAAVRGHQIPRGCWQLGRHRRAVIWASWACHQIQATIPEVNSSRLGWFWVTQPSGDTGHQPQTRRPAGLRRCGSRLWSSQNVYGWTSRIDLSQHHCVLPGQMEVSSPFAVFSHWMTD